MQPLPVSACVWAQRPARNDWPLSSVRRMGTSLSQWLQPTPTAGCNACRQTGPLGRESPYFPFFLTNRMLHSSRASSRIAIVFLIVYILCRRIGLKATQIVVRLRFQYYSPEVCVFLYILCLRDTADIWLSGCGNRLPHCSSYLADQMPRCGLGATLCPLRKGRSSRHLCRTGHST